MLNCNMNQVKWWVFGSNCRNFVTPFILQYPVSTKGAKIFNQFNLLIWGNKFEFKTYKFKLGYQIDDWNWSLNHDPIASCHFILTYWRHQNDKWKMNHLSRSAGEGWDFLICRGDTLFARPLSNEVVNMTWHDVMSSDFNGTTLFPLIFGPL